MMLRWTHAYPLGNIEQPCTIVCSGQERTDRQKHGGPLTRGAEALVVSGSHATKGKDETGKRFLQSFKGRDILARRSNFRFLRFQKTFHHESSGFEGEANKI